MNKKKDKLARFHKWIGTIGAICGITGITVFSNIDLISIINKFFKEGIEIITLKKQIEESNYKENKIKNGKEISVTQEKDDGFYLDTCRELWIKKEFENALNISRESSNTELINKCEKYSTIKSYFDVLYNHLILNDFENATDYINEDIFKCVYEYLDETDLSSLSFEYENKIVGIFEKNRYYVYWGENKNGIPHGHGYWMHKSYDCLDVFETDWINGIPEGECNFSRYKKKKLQNTYQGEVVDGLWNGLIEVVDYYDDYTQEYNLEYKDGIVQYFEKILDEDSGIYFYVIAFGDSWTVSTTNVEMTEGVSGFSFF